MSLRETARVTLELLERGSYESASGQPVDIAADQRAAVAGTVTWSPRRLLELVRERVAASNDDGAAPQIDLTDETTQQAAQRLGAAHPDDDVAVLNFASARNPGGGFLNGARAQEEELCRCSGLYPCLLEQRGYYEANRVQSSMLYTDHMIHSPRVPWFRIKGTGELLDAPYFASVITAPAPNAGAMRQRKQTVGNAVRETFERRWAMVLALAAHHGHRTVVLGAWGCGAFGNEPSMVADAFAVSFEAVGPKLAGQVARVVFAIPNRGASASNLAAFRARLAHV